METTKNPFATPVLDADEADVDRETDDIEVGDDEDDELESVDEVLTDEDEEEEEESAEEAA